jgi:tetratricopeptide (TPR) repeat protein
MAIETQQFNSDDETRKITGGTRAMSEEEMHAVLGRKPGESETADLGSEGRTAELPRPGPRRRRVGAATFPEAHLDLGRVLYDLGQGQDAVVEFRKAIEQRGDLFPRAHYELGRALIRAGRTGEAMAELERAIEEQSGVFPEAFFQIGQLQSRHGDQDAAVDAYQTAIKQSGGVYPEAYYCLGLSSVRSRNNEAGVKAYRTAIEQRGGFYPEAHQDLGRVLYSMGNLQGANEEYSIAVRQRNPGAGLPKTAELKTGKAQAAGSSTVRLPREDAVAEELQSGLRQAPAAADTGKGATAALSSNVLPDEVGMATEPLPSAPAREPDRGGKKRR